MTIPNLSGEALVGHVGGPIWPVKPEMATVGSRKKTDLSRSIPFRDLHVPLNG